MLVEIKKMIADSLTFDEFMIIHDYFVSLDVSEADKILSALVQYREVTDVVRLTDDNKVHAAPFALVPAELMKKIDRYYLEEL